MAYPDFHKVACEMCARNQLRVAHVAQCALVGASDARSGELLGDLLRALAPPAACGAQALGQLRIVGIKAQANDVDSGADERHGNLDPRQIGQAQAACRLGCTVLAADLVVVGQRPEIHAVGMGPCGQCLGRERAVRDHGVAVEVGVQRKIHGFILRVCPKRCCVGAFLSSQPCTRRMRGHWKHLLHPRQRSNP